jgi:hypothetical protein
MNLSPIYCIITHLCMNEFLYWHDSFIICYFVVI